MIKSKLTDGSSRVECRARKRTCAWLVFTAVMMTVAAGAKNKTTLPQLVVHAKYILVTTYNGPDLTNPRVVPDDRQAAADVELAIRKWGQYIVVNGTSQPPDLVLLVRKGRIAAVMPSVGVHAGSDSKSTINPNTDADMGSSQDMLALYQAPEGVDSAPLWRGLQAGGLDPPSMQLVQKLRAEVEAAAKVP